MISSPVPEHPADTATEPWEHLFEPSPTITRSGRCTVLGLPVVLVLILTAGAARAADSYADHVENYIGGTGVNSAYAHPEVAIGEPARFSADPFYPSVVSMVSPPFLDSQIVQLGGGGSITVKFDEPVTSHPAHPYGVDLIVFGNSFFTADYPSGAITNPASLFGDGSGRIEVSADGISFFEIPNVFADRLFPTLGYLDSGAFDGAPGHLPSDFLRPVNPALTLNDFSGLSFEQAVALYNGSGGGTPVDIAAAVNGQGQPAGLVSVSYVRVTNAGTTPLEIDAFAAVPEPITALLLVSLVTVGARKRSPGRQGICAS